MRALIWFIEGLKNAFFSTRVRVEGDSMLPLLRHGESVMMIRPGSRWNSLRRGDVVVFERPGGPSNSKSIYIKRIAGLPDEDIKIAGGWVFWNDDLLGEDYVQNTPKVDTKEWFNGPGEYFLLGDNRGDSNDSRAFGPVAEELIIGRVWLRCWPVSRWLPIVRH